MINPRVHFSSLPYLLRTIPTSFLNHCNIQSKMLTVGNSSCGVFQPPVISSLPGPNNLFSTMFNIFNLCVSHYVKDQVSHSHNNDNTINTTLIHLRQSYASLVVTLLLLLILLLLLHIPCCPFRCGVHSATVIVISRSFLIPC